MTLDAVACVFFLCFSSFNKFKIKFSLNCRQSRRRPGQNPIRRKCFPSLSIPLHPVSLSISLDCLPSAQLAELHVSTGCSEVSLLGIGSVRAQLQQSNRSPSCLNHFGSVRYGSSLSLSPSVCLFRSVTFKLCLMLFFFFCFVGCQRKMPPKEQNTRKESLTYTSRRLDTLAVNRSSFNSHI